MKIKEDRRDKIKVKDIQRQDQTEKKGRQARWKRDDGEGGGGKI